MRHLLLVVVLLPMQVSCDIQEAREAASRMESSNSLRQVGLGLQNYHDTFQSLPFGARAADAQAISLQAGEDAQADKQIAGRQIIYRASINLHVESFVKTDEKITVLVKDAGGYISQFGEDRSYGAQRGGRWTVRVPVDKFFAFLDSVGQLGVTEKRDVQSQDVTEEFVDLEARLKNKQALESRLLELVANRGDEIKDVLALETELSRVREEIERMQGRLRYLNDRVSLTSVELTAYERSDYHPPEATFAARIGSTFWLSLDRLRQFAEDAVIAIAALSPWAIASAIVLAPVGLIVRRRWRGRQRLTSLPAA